MKFGSPISREIEKSFAYWILTSQSSPGYLSLLAFFRNNNEQDQALGGEEIQVFLEDIVRST